MIPQTDPRKIFTLRCGKKADNCVAVSTLIYFCFPESIIFVLFGCVGEPGSWCAVGAAGTGGNGGGGGNGGSGGGGLNGNGTQSTYGGGVGQ